MVDPFAPKQGIPHALVMGKFAAWTLPPQNHPMRCVITKGDIKVTIPETASGTFEAKAAITDALVEGENRFDVVVVRETDGEEIIVRSDVVQVHKTTESLRTHAQIMVAKIESLLENRADQDVSSYTIKSRSISKMSVQELTEWRDFYLAEIGREVDPLSGRKKRRNTLRVGFNGS